MVHGERAAARQRWRSRLDDVGLVDALASVLANLEVEESAPTSVAPSLAASAVADATFAIISRLLGGSGGGGTPTARRQGSHPRAASFTASPTSFSGKLAAADAQQPEGGSPLKRLLMRELAAHLPPPPLGALLAKVGRCRVGLLIDLDGTLYSPLGLLPGALCLYERLVASGIPFVFLSNTGAKARSGVAAKFSAPPFLLPGPPIDPSLHIWTAADAQVGAPKAPSARSSARRCALPLALA